MVAQVELTYFVHVIATGIDVQEKTKFMEPLLTHLAERSWNEQSKTNVNGNKRKPLIRLSPCTVMTLGLEVLKLLGRTTQGSEALFSEKV
jgi:hypothetical protein